jgi:alpha-tubulin suppressor-like RCC1 family protein
VSSGGSHTLAIKTTGTLWSWGGNSYGQLGQGNTTSRSSPVQIGTDTNWAFCKAGLRSSLAVKTNGTLWSWGRNTLGELGLGNATNRSSPVQIGTNTDWLTTTDNISPNYSSSFAVLNSSNNIFVFGYNLQGQLGVSQNAAVSPVQIGSDTNWSSFDAGNNISAAVKTTGTLWAWGQNSYGQLGLRDTTNRSSPVQVGTDTNWSSVRCGYNFTVGLKTTGTLWSWGRNNIGQLGLSNTGTNRSSPVQIGTDTDWSLIFTRRYISKAIKTNGTLWAWGNNSYGSAMTLNRHVSSPIQVGTDSTWIIVQVNKYKTTAAVKS